jgi:putative FmdB family regulatory protein
MPAYDYRCAKCAKHVTEVRAIEEDNPNPTCCDNPMIRLYNFGAVTFNGSGFYTTDKGK